MKNNLRISGVVLLVLLISSCLKGDLDVGVLRDPIQSSWAAPLFSVRFGLNEVNVLSEFTQVRDDGFVELLYRRDSVIVQDAAAYFDLVRDPFLLSEKISLKSDTIFNFFEIETTQDIILNRVNFLDGWLRYSFAASTPVGTKVRLEIFNAERDGEAAVFILSRTGIDTKGSFDIGNYILDFGTSVNPNEMGYAITLMAAPGLENHEWVEFQWGFEDIRGEWADGYFGKRLFEIVEGAYGVDLEGLNSFDGGILFEHPNFQLDISNGIGVPFEFIPTLTVEKNGVRSQVALPIVRLDGAKGHGDPEKKLIVFDRDNSGIRSLFEEIPDKIILSGEIWANPDGETGQLNFANRFDDLVVHAALVLPLEFSTERLSYTSKLDNINFWADAPGTLQTLELIFTNTNSFPFSAAFEFVFFDESDIALDTVGLALIQAALTDNTGRVRQAVQYESSKRFEREDLYKLENSKSAQVKVTLFTPSDGTSLVRLYDDYFFDSRIRFKADLDYLLPN